jgi:hypothetical protein
LATSRPRSIISTEGLRFFGRDGNSLVPDELQVEMRLSQARLARQPKALDELLVGALFKDFASQLKLFEQSGDLEPVEDRVPVRVNETKLAEPDIVFLRQYGCREIEAFIDNRSLLVGNDRPDVRHLWREYRSFTRISQAGKPDVR